MRRILLIPILLVGCAADKPPAASPMAAGSVVVPPDVVARLKESIILCGSGHEPDACMQVLDYLTASMVKTPPAASK
jgi:hypothetical protein